MGFLLLELQFLPSVLIAVLHAASAFAFATAAAVFVVLSIALDIVAASAAHTSFVSVNAAAASIAAAAPPHSLRVIFVYRLSLKSLIFVACLLTLLYFTSVSLILYFCWNILCSAHACMRSVSACVIPILRKLFGTLTRENL